MKRKPGKLSKMNTHQKVTKSAPEAVQLQRRPTDQGLEDTQMPDAPNGPSMTEDSETPNLGRRKQGGDAAQAAHAAFAKGEKNPPVPPKDPIDPSPVKNPRGPPVIASRKPTAADQPEARSKTEVELRQQVDNERERSNKLAAEVSHHRAAHEATKADLLKIQQDHKTLHHQYKVGGQQYAELRIDAQNGENHRQDLALQLEDAKERIAELKSQLDGQEARVTKAQVAAVSLLSNTVSTTLPDDVVRRRFAELFESFQEWSREYATEGFDPAHIESIRKKLIKGFVLGDGKGVAKAHLFDLQDSTAPATLLNAAVTLSICRAFLGDPFFCASLDAPGQQNRSGLPKSDKKELLEDIWNHFLEENVAEAHSWRAQTLRMFSTSKLHRPNFEHYCRKTTDDICDRHSELLDQGLIKKAHSALLDPVTRFGELALQLWSVKSDIAYYHLKDFADKPFALASEEMQAARVVRLDEYDTALDNRPIQVVVQPMIAAFGTPDGREYEKKKIWAKATVWISNRDRPEPKMITRTGTGDKQSHSRLSGYFSGR